MDEKQEKMLLKLAAGLRKVPKQKFNMEIIGAGKLKVRSESFECGFAGCALGWAPRFVPEAKLKHVPQHLPNMGKPCFCYSCEEGRRNGLSYVSIRHTPSRRSGFDAAMEAFGLSRSEADELFLPNVGNKTPKQVALNLERFVKRKRK